MREISPEALSSRVPSLSSDPQCAPSFELQRQNAGPSKTVPAFLRPLSTCLAFRCQNAAKRFIFAPSHAEFSFPFIRTTTRIEP